MFQRFAQFLNFDHDESRRHSFHGCVRDRSRKISSSETTSSTGKLSRKLDSLRQLAVPLILDTRDKEDSLIVFKCGKLQPGLAAPPAWAAIFSKPAAQCENKSVPPS
jgi:hypothetical protein